MNGIKGTFKRNNGAAVDITSFDDSDSEVDELGMPMNEPVIEETHVIPDCDRLDYQRNDGYNS